MEYNKLVRDKIPEIIANKGGTAHVRFLTEEEFPVYLEAKLDEEIAEFHKDKNVEELADILEVVFSLADSLGCSREELMRAYQNKHDERGGFEQKLFLISSESANG